MAREKKNALEYATEREGKADARGARRFVNTRIALLSLAWIAGLAAVGFGLHQVYGYVDTKVAFSPEPPQVVLKHRPAWMTDLLYNQICAAARPAGGHSALSSQMLKDVKVMLENNIRTNSWIKQIKQLKLVYGQKPGDTLVLDCEFRAPIALVHHNDYYYLVDGDGFALPERYRFDQISKIIFAADGTLNMRVIEGVQNERPMPGAKWTGGDLAAGLELAKVLYARPFAEDVIKIDVSNFAGRQDARQAQLVLITKRNTEVRWGRPWSSQDRIAEVPALQKLQSIKSIYEQYGRVDAGYPWVDLRFDRVTHPSEVPAVQASMQ